MRFALLLSAFATPLLAAPLPKAPVPPAKVPNYFPCELRTKWEYECGKDSTVVEVTKVWHEADCKIVTFTHTRPATGASCDIRYRVTKTAVFLLETHKQREFETLALDFGAKPGDVWTLNAPGHFADGAKITTREPKKVEVPAGTFAVIGNTMTFPGVPVDVFQITNFYADGVGRVLSPGGKPNEPLIVLKKFTPPPK